MQPFRNILVGVDLAQYDATSHQPSVVARAVVQQALWLAAKMNARLTFFAALNLTTESLPYLDESDRQHLTQSAERAAGTILDNLVRQAETQGIKAGKKLALGGSWLELIRQVLRDKHDLLLVGTRDRKGLGRMIFGSTAIKLVRRCPCPVWVAKPEGIPTPLNILVASDLSPAAEDALGLAVNLARVTPANIHLLHVVDFPLDHIWSTGLPDAKEEAYRRDLRHRAEQALQSQVNRAGAQDLSPGVQVHLVDDMGGLADEGILGYIQTHKIDLLVMGTIGRSGIPGVMIGNTAERILPDLTCSLLAVKPAGFVSPVRL
ncbi:MAG TPA: universal stress protein [Gemmataceae bacterium]|nr:universal stress protein [Gemmataceae bacterium]